MGKPIKGIWIFFCKISKYFNEYSDTKFSDLGKFLVLFSYFFSRTWDTLQNI